MAKWARKDLRQEEEVERIGKKKEKEGKLIVRIQPQGKDTVIGILLSKGLETVNNDKTLCI